MINLDRAKELLFGGEICLAAVSEKGEFTKVEAGIKPLIELMIGGALVNAYVADKVVGKAAAFVMAAAGVKEVYAKVISEHAQNVFKSENIKVEVGEIVPNIKNRAKTDMCPMEKLCLNITNKTEAVKVLKEKLNM